jgi:hypothetical protein
LPALLCLNLDLREFLLIASPLATLGYGVLVGLEAMATNRFHRLIWAATIPFLHLYRVIQIIASAASRSD